MKTLLRLFVGTASALIISPTCFAQHYTQTNLVSNMAGGVAPVTDPQLINPWGMSRGFRKPSIEAGSAPFVEMQNMIRDAIAQHILRRDLPMELISKTMAALAEATMDLIVLKPAMANKYRNSGFEMYWAGITRK